MTSSKLEKLFKQKILTIIATKYYLTPLLIECISACIILFLTHFFLSFFQETGVTAFAHFDEYLERYERYDTLEAFLDKFQRLVIHRTYYGYLDDDYGNNDNWVGTSYPAISMPKMPNDQCQNMTDVQTIQLVYNDSQENRKLGTYLRAQLLPSY